MILDRARRRVAASIILKTSATAFVSPVCWRKRFDDTGEVTKGLQQFFGQCFYILSGQCPKQNKFQYFGIRRRCWFGLKEPIAQCLAFVCDQHRRPDARRVNGCGLVQIEKVAGFSKCGMSVVLELRFAKLDYWMVNQPRSLWFRTERILS